MEIVEKKGSIILNILYYFKEKDTLMDKWQRYHIFDELERHGCHITVYNPLDFNSIDEANINLTEFIKNNNFDLFMTPHNENDLFVETLANVKKYGLPTLLICFDNLLIPYYHKKIAQYFDLVWLTSKETEYMFIKWGAKTIFNPYAANPHYFKPNYTKEIERVVFIGSPYGSRVNIINHLTANDIGVSLYTGGFTGKNGNRKNQNVMSYFSPALDMIGFGIGRKVILGALMQKILKTENLNTQNNNIEIRPSIAMEKLSSVYSDYALSLASTSARNTGILKNPVNVVNLRSFEIPMSGGMQICTYFEEIANYFEEDKEIIFYRTNDELIEKAMFYLKDINTDLRLKIKIAARNRAENEHTWYIRFKKVFDFLGLKYC